MDTLFGVSMDIWMAIMLTLFLIVTGVVLLLALRNRLFVKLGLRNLPRRRAQTVLIVVGLMLATVIITSALGVGDTISYSLRSGYVQSLGPVDELVGTQAGFSNGTTSYFPTGVTARIQQRLAAAAPVAGVAPAIVETVAIQDLTTRQTKARMGILGVPINFPAAFGPITATGGTSQSLGQLTANQVYLNNLAAQSLGARAGDTLVVYFNGKPATLVVRSIVKNENLAAGGLSALNGRSKIADPAILLPLDRLQSLAGQIGRINLVLVSNTGDPLTGAKLSDMVADQVRALLADPVQLATATTQLVSPAGRVLLKAVAGQSNVSGDTTLKRDFATITTLVTLAAPSQAQRDQLAAILSKPGVLAAFTSYKPDRSVARQYATVAAPLGQALVSISPYQVVTIKQTILDAANLAGSFFTGLFIIFGIFSVVAGIMLIFLIFVMLAAERRAEMGMARAVGTKRRDLIQQFLFEGYAYNLGSALVGIGLGVAISLVMASVLNGLLGSSTSGLDLQSHIQVRTLVVAFCLGALITFLTVAVSSWRVSRLNVVAAIRDLPDDFGIDISLGGAWKRTVGNFLVNPRRHTLRFVLTVLALVVGVVSLRFGIGFLLLLPLIWPIFAALTSRGPLLILAGVLVTKLSEINTPPNGPVFRIGISLLLIGAAMLLRWILGGARVPDRIRNRIGYTLAGAAVVAFYLIPINNFHATGKPDFDTGPYEILLSGIMLVLGSVWAVMFNADLLLKGILLAFGGNGRLAPSLKMAVSYPMQNKFRTGLTVAMFSLVIFILMLVAVLLTSIRTTLNLDRDLGGFAIYGATSPLNPIPDAYRAVAANPTLHAAIDGAGGLAILQVGLRQPGQPDQSFQDYTAKVADTGYLQHQRWTLQSHAVGYSDAQVWQALRTTPGVAVVSGDLLPQGTGGRRFDGFQFSGVYYEDQNFDPAARTAQMIDHRTNKVLTIRVIGVISRSAVNNLQDLASGVYIGQPTLTAAHDAPAIPTTFFFHLAPGQDRHQAALALGSAFLANGLDVKETQVEYDNAQAITNGLFNLIEGFMGLGLIVGVAALGVVSLRSVVERRQQIGMMRAIGFQRSMIRSSFLLESSFISILGTLLGVVLGVLLANQYISEQAKSDPTIHLVIPWPQVAIILLIAYAASLLTTYLPARQASHIYPAEALRYE